MSGGDEVMWQLLSVLVGTLISAAIAMSIGYHEGTKAIQAKWDAEKAALVTSQRTKEAELQANMDKLRTEKNRETAKLQRAVAALTDSLRDRPDRPADPASSAGASSAGCTGAELYKPDGNFLVGEAARADQIRLALKSCQDAYQAASK